MITSDLMDVNESLPTSTADPLIDRFNRRITYLRISVIDRCNYRCLYCMPDDVEFSKQQELLTFDEIYRLIVLFAKLGIKRLRITGGEPTVRPQISELIARLSQIETIEAIVMTSNGHRLVTLAESLKNSNLCEINVSLDTVDEADFSKITNGGNLRQVIEGIDAALAQGIKIKLNTVVMPSTDAKVIGSICSFAWERGIVPRFIEQMPMSSGSLVSVGHRLMAVDIRKIIEETFDSQLVPVLMDQSNIGPARYWNLSGDAHSCFGIISAMSENFCDSCNRMRLTATGKLHTCLAFDDDADLRGAMRCGASDAMIEGMIRKNLDYKRQGHEFHSKQPQKHMISIGG